MDESFKRWASFAVTDKVPRLDVRSVGEAPPETLQHGIDVEATAKAVADRDAVRAELGIGLDEIVVGTVANFRPQKDYPNLLQAARLLADREVPVRFVAVGQGPQEAGRGSSVTTWVSPTGWSSPGSTMTRCG